MIDDTRYADGMLISSVRISPWFPNGKRKKKSVSLVIEIGVSRGQRSTPYVRVLGPDGPLTEWARIDRTDLETLGELVRLSRARVSSQRSSEKEST